MAIARFGRQVKRSYQSYGFCIKLSAVVILGLCFVLVWSVFSSFSVTSRRESFDDIAEPVSASNGKVTDFQIHPNNQEPKKGQESGKQRFSSGFGDRDKKGNNGSVPLKSEKKPEKVNAKSGERVSDGSSKLSKGGGEKKNQENEGSEEEEVIKEKDDEEGNDKEGEDVDNDGDSNEAVEGDVDLINTEDLNSEVDDEDNNGGSTKGSKKKLGPLFDPKKHYAWKLCNTRSKHNYIPCIDIESATTRLQSYRHHERSCPKSAVMCLVPLPRDGYGTPVPWPESKLKVPLQSFILDMDL